MSVERPRARPRRPLSVEYGPGAWGPGSTTSCWPRRRWSRAIDAVADADRRDARRSAARTPAAAPTTRCSRSGRRATWRSSPPTPPSPACRRSRSVSEDLGGVPAARRRSPSGATTSTSRSPRCATPAWPTSATRSRCRAHRPDGRGAVVAAGVRRARRRRRPPVPDLVGRRRQPHPRQPARRPARRHCAPAIPIPARPPSCSPTSASHVDVERITDPVAAGHDRDADRPRRADLNPDPRDLGAKPAQDCDGSAPR